MPENLIGRTTEILVRRYGLDADGADDLLTWLSIYYQQPITEVAERLIGQIPSTAITDQTLISHPQALAALCRVPGTHDIHVMIAALAPYVRRTPPDGGQASAQLRAVAPSSMPEADFARHFRPRPSRQTGTYDDVPEMFRQMIAMPADSVKRKRARDALVRRCLPLADNLAYRFKGRGEPSEDIVQVARLGLVNAVNRFDVNTGNDFLAFAVPTIVGELRRHFRDNSWAVKVPRRLKEFNLELGTASAELSQRLGRAPTPSELAAELNLAREEVIESLIAGSAYRTVSMDRPVGDDPVPPLIKAVGSRDASLDRIVDREALRPLLEALPERERRVIGLRFFESLTQSQIAEQLGISQMHVSRLLARTLAKLRDKLQ